jgi:outer membrane protein TolC
MFMPQRATQCGREYGLSFCSACLAVAVLTGTATADPPALIALAVPSSLTLNDAIAFALQNNPELAAIRQQHGIAAAAVVIARTYPYNPAWVNRVMGDGGPTSAGISNRVFTEQRLEFQVEIRGQGGYRRRAASAALTRTDWEIAFQEQALALRVIRAFNGVLYQDAKLRLGEETIRLNQETVARVEKLAQAKVLGPSDLILARSEVDASRALLGAARAAQLLARQDLRRALGVTEDAYTIQGALDAPLPPIGEAALLVSTALDRRPDLHARQAAVQEATASVGLARADRFGNPLVAPNFEYNETRAYFIGAEVSLPLPILNTHRGEIQQRQAERARATLELRNNEITIRQEVQAALDRLQNARTWAATYRTEVLPNLEKSLRDAQALLSQAGVPVLSVIDLQRKLLQARGGYLDVLYELSQAQADLSYAVGDPGLAVAP